MADHPARSEAATASDGSREQGWGPPLPSEYGPLGTYRMRPNSGDGATSRPRPSRVTVSPSSPAWSVRAAWDGLGRVGRALRRTTPDSGQPGIRPPSWDDWNGDGRRSPTAASTAYRSSARSDGATARSGLLRDLARSVVETSKQAARPSQPVPPSPAVAGQRPEATPLAVGPTRVVTHLDVYSVAKVSIVFYLILLVVFVVASFLLWLVADAFGAVDSIQRSIRSLFDLKSFALHPITIALYASAAGAVLAVAGTIANVLAAVIYNLISEVIGGVRIGISPGHDEAA